MNRDDLNEKSINFKGKDIYPRSGMFYNRLPVVLDNNHSSTKHNSQMSNNRIAHNTVFYNCPPCNMTKGYLVLHKVLNFDCVLGQSHPLCLLVLAEHGFHFHHHLHHRPTDNCLFRNKLTNNKKANNLQLDIFLEVLRIVSFAMFLRCVRMKKAVRDAKYAKKYILESN